MESGLRRFIKTSLIPVDFILAVMEIEAWFPAEMTHYARIDPAITVAAIKGTLGFDPENDDLQQRPCPAEDLRNCYAIAGKDYRKGRAEDTVNALDFTEVYCNLTVKIDYLRKLSDIINDFLSLPLHNSFGSPAGLNLVGRPAVSGCRHPRRPGRARPGRARCRRSGRACGRMTASGFGAGIPTAVGPGRRDDGDARVWASWNGFAGIVRLRW